MKKFKPLLFLVSISSSFLSLGVTLNSMSKTEVEQAFINKTFTSIPTDNLNGRDIANSNAVFLDDQGHALSKMSIKPANQPQFDTGVYSIKNDGTLLIKWKHWDNGKQLCFHIFDTQNAYLSIDCGNVFHSAFMKASIKAGNQLK